MTRSASALFSWLMRRKTKRPMADSARILTLWALPDDLWQRIEMLIEQAHQEQVLGALPSRLVIEARAGKPDQLALTADADQIVVRLDQLSLPISRADQLFF